MGMVDERITNRSNGLEDPQIYAAAKVEDPPYFRGAPIIGSIKEFHNNAPSLYLRAFERYPHDDVVRLSLGHYRNVYLVRGPEYIEQVLRTNMENYPKAGYELLEPLIGNGLLSNEDPSFRQQQKLMQPPLHGQDLKKLVPGMVHVVEQTMESWGHRVSNGERVFEIEEEMTQLTLGILTSTLFGKNLYDLGPEVGQALRFVLRHGIQRTGNLLAPPYSIPTPANRRYKKALRSLDRVVYSLIDAKRRRIAAESDSEQEDLLSKLITARDEETNETMTDRQLRDETMTLLTAGHETTAKALCWTLYLLDQHPEVRDNMRSEVRNLMDRSQPTAEVLSGPKEREGTLQETKRVFEESMRLYPPVPHLARAVNNEDIMGDYRVRGRAYVILSQFATHRNPWLWENAETFDPERFKERYARDRPRYAYFPFGGGIRSCIGNAFAYTEAEIILSMIVDRFELSLVPGHPIDVDSAFTLRPRYGLNMQVVHAR